MAAPTLSRRLSTLLAAIRPSEPVWDIGCDHARLGYAALEQRRASEAVLVDKSPAVIASVQAIVDAHVDDRLRERLTVTCADAARLPAQPVTGTVVIAGMGAWAMIRILDGFVAPNGAPPLRLVLQPAVQPERLRTWIGDSLFELVEELTVVEREREHHVMVAELRSSHRRDA